MKYNGVGHARGHVTTVGRDEKGYYIEGASMVLFGLGEFEEERDNEQA